MVLPHALRPTRASPLRSDEKNEARASKLVTSVVSIACDLLRGETNTGAMKIGVPGKVRRSADRSRRHGKKNLIAAVVSSASNMARPPVRIVGLAVASLALPLMLFRRGLDVTMMIRSCLPPCYGWG